MVELQDLPCKIVEVDMQDFPTIMGELELWVSIEIPGTPIRLAERQILEEFMLEEEIEFQGIDKCKIMELPDEQELEESIEEEVSNIILPERYRAEESIQKDELKLETPIINKVEISELPKEVKLEMPMEQNGSKLRQDVNMDSDVPTPFHVVPNRNILSKSISKLHARWGKVFRSKLVRRVKPTKLVKRKIPSICRPPPKPPYRQNRLNVKVSKRILSKMHAKEERVNYRPPPKPPYILNVNGEVIGIIENMVPKRRPPPKPPRIHSNADRERIKDLEKECLLDTVLNYRPLPKPPPNSLWQSQGIMDKGNLKQDTNIYNILRMKFSTSSCGKILAPLAYIKVVQ